MDQELFISKEIIRYLNENLPAYKINDAMKAIDYIEQNYIICDKKKQYHFNNITDSIDSLENNPKKEEIKRIVDNWINTKRKFIDCDFDSSDESIYNLTLKTEDKIYFNPFLSPKEKDNLSIKYKDIEFHHIQSFINPQHYNRLKHIETKICLEKNCYYDLIKILTPFLKYAKNVEILDPYLFNDLASKNLLKIIDNFKEKTFNLIFLHDDKNKDNIEYKKKYDNFIKKLKELVDDGYKVKFDEKIRKKRHFQRHIKTEKYHISIPGGLDFLNSEGYINTNDVLNDKKEIIINLSEQSI